MVFYGDMMHCNWWVNHADIPVPIEPHQHDDPQVQGKLIKNAIHNGMQIMMGELT